MKNCRTSIVAIIFVFVSTGTAQETKSFLSVQDIFSGWQKNYGEMKSMEVSYTEEVVSAEPPRRDPNIINRMIRWVYVESFIEEGRKYRGKSLTARVKPSTAEKSFNDINSVEEVTYDGIHQRRYSPAEKTGQIFAGQFLRNASTINRFRSYLVSNPHIENSGIEGEESVFSHRIKQGLTDPNYTISVRPGLEKVAGQMCHVMELKFIKTNAIVAIIWVAHEKGMLLMRFQEFGSETRVAYEIAVEEIGFAGTENGGLWYPKKAYNFWNMPDTLGVIKQEFNVLKFVPNIKTDRNTFSLDFPNGTQVGDAELGTTYTVGVTLEKQ